MVLEKATLVDLDDSKAEPVSVQFNPTSLRLQMTNNVDTGKQRGRMVAQHNGQASSILTLDLVFDTADEADPDPKHPGARSVRTKTQEVEKFVLPKGKSSKQAPPRVGFHWGSFSFKGMMTSLSEDIDLFSDEGVPLRAKVSISIKEQDPKFEALLSGAGANRDERASVAGTSATGPGTGGPGGTRTPAADRTASAIGGESAAEFAARNGVDPAAWRGIEGLDDPLSLPAGLEVGFNSGLTASSPPVPGLTAGVGSVEASLGLIARTPAASAAAPGFALSAAGGVSAAAQTVQAVASESAAARSRAAFESPSPGPSSMQVGREGPETRATTLGLGTLPAGLAAAAESGYPQTIPGGVAPEQTHAGLYGRALPTATEQAEAPAAPLPPLADPRASSFGYGVPLRPRNRGAAEELPPTRGWVVIGRRVLRAAAAFSQDPTAPPWRSLPGIDAVREHADRRQREVSPPRPCRCGGAGSRRCTCGGLR